MAVHGGEIECEKTLEACIFNYVDKNCLQYFP